MAEADRYKNRRGAFSLLEVLAVAAILVIIGALIVPNINNWLAIAAQARCMTNMRALSFGANAYLNDHKQVWPQGPLPSDAAPWAKFWIETLEPYGVKPTSWRCPAIEKMLGGGPAAGAYGDKSIHYVPTMFDPRPNVAHRWPTQPWFVERANAHGNGALLSFADGSIRPFNKVLAEQGLR